MGVSAGFVTSSKGYRSCLFDGSKTTYYLQLPTTKAVGRVQDLGIQCYALQTSHNDLLQLHPQHSYLERLQAAASRVPRAVGVTMLGSCLVLGRSNGAAVASSLRSPQPLETVVIAPQTVTAAAAAVPTESDNLSLLMAVCMAFWVASATVSAGIGAIMKLAGCPMAQASNGGGGWSTAGVMDTLDIMTLPGYEEDYTANPPSSSSVAYVPWEGPQGYIPVSMVKVLQPGAYEAGRVARPSMLQGDISNLRIVSVSRPAEAAPTTSPLPTIGAGNGNGCGNSSSSQSNGSSNGKQEDTKE